MSIAPVVETMRLKTGADIGVLRDDADHYRIVVLGPGVSFAIELRTDDVAQLADTLLVLSEADREERRAKRQH